MAEDLKKHRTHCTRWVHRLFVVCVLIVGAWVAYDWSSTAAHAETQAHSPWAGVPRAYRQGKPLHERQPVLGDINGASVSIPFEYLFHLPISYDGDPHFLEPRTGQAPERTLDSKLAGFSLLVQRPDMKPMSPENAQNYRDKTIYDDDWLVVSVQANSAFNPVYEYSLRLYERQIEWAETESTVTGRKNKFVEQTRPVHGLVEAVSEGYDYTRYDYSNKIFYYRREDGRIKTLIKCGAGPAAVPGGVKTCTHYFMLLPDACAEVRFQYGPVALPHWRDMEDKVRRLLMRFVVKRSTGPARCSGVMPKQP